MIVRQGVLVECSGNSTSHLGAALVFTFKAGQLVIDVLGQTLGHLCATGNNSAIAHDLPQIVFGGFAHVSIVTRGLVIALRTAHHNL